MTIRLVTYAVTVTDDTDDPEQWREAVANGTAETYSDTLLGEEDA